MEDESNVFSFSREGIPYVNRAHAEELRKTLADQLKQLGSGTEQQEGTVANGTTAATTAPPLPAGGGTTTPAAPVKKLRMTLKKPADIATTSKALENLKNWLADETRKDETEFDLITTNSYLRRFIYEALAADFPTVVVETRAPGEGGARNQATMVVRRFLNVEQKEFYITQKRKEKTDRTNTQLGFFRVYEALVAAKRPVVGHAVMFDLLFLMAHCEGQLPESYADFKVLARERFPLLYDTQFLCKNTALAFVGEMDESVSENEKVHRFGSMALGNIHKTLTEDPLCKNLEVEFSPLVGGAISKNYGAPDCKVRSTSNVVAWNRNAC